MSKKKKKNRTKVQRKRVPSAIVRDRHHLCWIHAKWTSKYAKLICDAFVRLVPIVYHRELHQLIKEVPVPDEKLLKEAWLKYKEEQEKVDSYGVARAAAWLYVNIPDPEFRKAMQFQVDFFTTKDLP